MRQHAQAMQRCFLNGAIHDKAKAPTCVRKTTQPSLRATEITYFAFLDFSSSEEPAHERQRWISRCDHRGWVTARLPGSDTVQASVAQTN